MSKRPENPFEPRLGRIRSGGNARRGRAFMSKVARSVSRAGPSGRGFRRTRSKQSGKIYARRVVVKARFVRSAMSSPKALAEHLRYISRDSANRADDQGRVFDGHHDDIDRDRFAESAKDDRHHFRLIVSPEDGAEMHDLKPFVRDLVSSMEKDLETRLDWVAAVHDNTDHPHAHIVIRGKRDDGRDLVMPRAYIAQGIRQRAEELVTLELGPETGLERDVKLARQTGVEHLTQIDRTLSRMSDADGVLNLRHAPVRYQSLNAERLRKLSSIGLAEHLSAQKWKLAKGFETTLQELGEQRDIIKQIHRALGNKPNRVLDPARPFSGAAGRVPVTGAVLRSGMTGEGYDTRFVIVDGLDGRVVSVRLADPEAQSSLRPGMIVTLSPPEIEPRPSDRTIATIASQNGGVYSAALHQQADHRSTPVFVTAHIRRLEAMRRAGLVERRRDGSWSVPDQYLDAVRRHQERSASRMGASVNVESWMDIAKQVDAHGLTWLDQVPVPDAPIQGFGEEVRSAIQQRRARLFERGLIDRADGALGRDTQERLRRAGLDAAGAELSSEYGKPYAPLPRRGTIEGVYKKAITMPEGKFAVIDRQKSITLAPWREVMDRARGQVISGMVRGGSVTWNIGLKRGLSQ